MAGPADHLDLLCRQRIDRYEVVLPQIRNAAAADAVLDNADPVNVQAANDRPRWRIDR